jgi:hypothetical protein
MELSKEIFRTKKINETDLPVIFKLTKGVEQNFSKVKSHKIRNNVFIKTNYFLYLEFYKPILL